MAIEPTLNKIERINVHFVLISDEAKENCSDILSQCAKRICTLNVRNDWISGTDCLKLNNFSKCDVFVLDRFNGNVFDHLSHHASKCLIVSPEFLIQCISEHKPIPYSTYPVFSFAMHGLFITFSSVLKNEKDEAKKQIQYMCGNYSDDLIVGITHLVVSNIMSRKYYKACEYGIPLMTFDWIQSVWRDSCADITVRAVDHKYDYYKCPLFYKMNITISSLDEDERKNIVNIINKNGGIWSSKILPGNTNALVSISNACPIVADARKRGIPCVKPSWILECVEKNYAVPFNQHLLRDPSARSSITNKGNECLPADVNFSMVKNGTDYVGLPVVVTTVASNGIKSLTSSKVSSVTYTTPKKQSSDRRYRQTLNDIVLNDVKKCGPILDGCKVFLSGFSQSDDDKLRSILNYSGALRFDDLNETITHVIIGNFSTSIVEKLNSLHNSPHVVKLDWLKDSIDRGHIVPEFEYQFGNTSFKNEQKLPAEHQSPLSKKGLEILTPEKNRNEVAMPLKKFPADADQHLINEYSQPLEIRKSLNFANVPTADDEPKTSNNDNNMNCCNDTVGDKEDSVLCNVAAAGNDDGDDSESTTTTEYLNGTDFFKDLLFKVINHDCATTNKIRDKIINYGGRVIDAASQTIADYVIIPIGNANLKQSFPWSKVVTFLWLNECVHNKMVMPVSYHHEPLNIPQFDTLPLSGCVLTFSQYELAEKMFLEHISVALGARCQDVLSKKDNKMANAAKTTHLICEIENGDKYKAAKKWNLPIVKKTWLLNCFKCREKLHPAEYVLCDNDNSNTTNKSDRSDLSNRIVVVNASTEQDDQKIKSKHPTSLGENRDSTTVDNVQKNYGNGDNAECDRRRLSSPATYKDMRPQFHSTMMMKPAAESNKCQSHSTWIKPDEPLFHSTAVQSPATQRRKNKLKYNNNNRSNSSNDNSFDQCSPFPPLKHLAYISANHTPTTTTTKQQKEQHICDKNDPEVEIQITTHCTNTSTICAVITTNSNSKTNISTTFSTTISVSPSAAALFGCNKPAITVTKPSVIADTGHSDVDTNNDIAVNDDDDDIDEATGSKSKIEQLSTPDGLLQQVKEISQLLTNASLLNKANEIDEPPTKVMYPFENFHRREKRKPEQQAKPKVDWLDTCNFYKRMRPGLKCPRASQFNHRHDALGLHLSESQINNNDNDDERNENRADEKNPTTDIVQQQNDDRNQQTAADLSSKIKEIEQEKNEEAEDGSAIEAEGEKNFVLSNFSDYTEKCQIENAIKKLGGNIVTCSGFDNAITHLITKKLIKSEKILCCIASGKWVLHPAFIEESERHMRFLREADYEWGNPCFGKNNVTSQQLAESAVRWREKISSSRQQCEQPIIDYSKGAFAGMKATFWADSTRTAVFTRLIEAGGGIVLPASKTLEATHLFIDNEQKYLTSMPFSLSALAKNYVHALPVTYINDHLTLNPVPKPELCYIDAYKKFCFNKSQ